MPIFVLLLDQLDLPRSPPPLKPFFPLDGVANVLVDFVIDQTMYTVFCRKAGNQVVAMFIHAAHEVIGHAYVQRTASTTRENVDVIGHGVLSPERDRKSRPELDPAELDCKRCTAGFFNIHLTVASQNSTARGGMGPGSHGFAARPG